MTLSKRHRQPAAGNRDAIADWVNALNSSKRDVSRCDRVRLRALDPLADRRQQNAVEL